MKSKVLKMIKMKRYFFIRSVLEEIYLEIDSLERLAKNRKVVSDTLASTICEIVEHSSPTWVSKMQKLGIDQKIQKSMETYERTR